MGIVKISMQKNSDCPIQYNQPQKETKGLVIEPEENSRSREISPDSPIRSRNVSADSSRSGFSFNSNESLEGYKEEYASSEKDLSNKRKKRKSDNLGLNGGYWDVIGVRGVVREKLEKQESIEKDEQIHVRSEKRSRRKDSSKKISKKDTDFEAGLTKHKHCSDTDISKAQPYDDSHESETLDTYIAKTRNENITFVQAIINDIILSLKTIEDTESPPKQTSIKRSPPSESKPSKRLKNNVTETQAQNTEQYQITGVIPQTDYTGLFTSDSLKPVSCEIKTITDSSGIKSKEDENKTDKLTSKAGKGKSCEIERRKKFQETKCKKSDKLSSKMGKRSPEPFKRKESILNTDRKECVREDAKITPDIYEFEDDVPTLGNRSNLQMKLGKQTAVINESTQNKEKPKKISEPLMEEVQDEMDLRDELVEDNEETAEIDNDIWSSINETLKDIKESTSKQSIAKPCTTAKSSVTKEKFQPMEDCKDSLLDDLNTSQNSGFDGWPFDGDNLKDEITGDNIDIWASTNEIMRSISESLSDVKTVKPTTSSTTLRDKKESKSSLEITTSRKSRLKRKDSDENLGNPDSGKENA